MLRRIFNGLKVKPDEQSQVVLLLVVGFCFGSFMVTFQISAEALFLNNLKHYLKEAILISGGLGMITTGLFSYLQSKIPYSKLVVGALSLIFLLTGLIYFLYFGTSAAVQPYVIFSMFVMIGPFIAVILLSFWGMFGRLFNLRQSKRIIGWIDTGQLSAAILATLSFPLLATLIPETANYFLISAVSILLGVFFVIIITTKFDLSQAEVSGAKDNGDDKSTKRQGFRTLIKDKYVILLSSFLIFSMVTFTFIQFSFQNVAALQYPEEGELRNFLAQFHLGYLLLSFILQTFVNDKIIGVYGLRVALFILPIIVGLFTLSSILTGFFFGFDPTTSPDTFIWFFLFISITRLFNYSLRDALENPTFKLFFMPLDNRTRFDVQTKVEGVVNETSRFLAGGLIMALSLVTFFELIHYSIAVLILVLGYMFVIGKLYNQYRNKIKLKLETQQASSDSEESQRVVMARSLELYLKKVQADKAVFLFKLLEKINPNAVGSSINKMMNHQSDSVRGYAQDRMNQLKGLSVSDKYVIQVGNGGEDTSVKNIVDGLDLEGLLTTGNITKRRISRLCKSDNLEDRQYAAELLGNSSENENISFLIELLHDSDANVRLTAINAAEKNFNDEIINSLTDNLAHPVISNNALNALVKIGGRALNALDIAFYRTGQNSKTMIKILQIYGRIGGNKSIKQLWSKIDYPNKVLVSEALLSLGECGFKAGISQISRIKFAIESDIQDVAWNLAASTEVSEVGGGDLLVDALREENHHDMEHIYMLMGMLYDARSIQLVKENMESGTTEGVTFAIELLDVFLSEDLKQKIIPLLDDISDGEKARKLEMFHPRARLNSKEVLKFLINRDYNQTNRWSKACAIYQIGHHKLEQYSLDVIANLFNPDQLVLEVSAWALYQIDPKLYEEHTRRIDREEKRRLDAIILEDRYDDGYRRLLMYDKVRFLKSIELFSGVEGLVLAAMANNLRDIFLDKDEVMILPRGEREYFYINYDGETELHRNDRPKRNVTKGEFVGEFVQVEHDQSNNSIVALSKSTLFRIRKDKFYELLSDNIDFARHVINYF